VPASHAEALPIDGSSKEATLSGAHSFNFREPDYFFAVGRIRTRPWTDEGYSS
jgi:hypothetical protein